MMLQLRWPTNAISTHTPLRSGYVLKGWTSEHLAGYGKWPLNPRKWFAVSVAAEKCTGWLF